MEVKVAMQALLSRMQDYAVTMDHIAPSGGANSNQMTATISEPSVGASDRYNDDEGAAAGESSTQGAKKGKEWTLEMSSHTRHCSVCREAYKDRNVVTLPGCGHVYCQGCLDRVYDLSMSGETPFPPRCCKTDLFHLQEVRRFLSHNRASAFKRKELEWSSTDPTYCWQRTCSAFIPPTAIASTQGGGKIGKCPTCMEKTCAICKRAAHQGRECLEKAGNDESTRALLRLVDEEKWQRCYNCQRLVEKISDCEHIKYVAYFLPSLLGLLLILKRDTDAFVGRSSAIRVVHPGKHVSVCRGMTMKTMKTMKTTMKTTVKTTTTTMKTMKTMKATTMMTMMMKFWIQYFSTRWSY